MWDTVLDQMRPGSTRARAHADSLFSSESAFFEKQRCRKACFFLFFYRYFLVVFMFFHMIADSFLLNIPGKTCIFSKQHLVSYIVFSLNVSCFFDVFWKVFGRNFFSFLMFFHAWECKFLWNMSVFAPEPPLNKNSFFVDGFFHVLLMRF